MSSTSISDSSRSVSPMSLMLWQLVTYMFLHGGFFHIFFNMLTLFMFGNELERYWGTPRFLNYYFITGIGAGVCSWIVAPHSFSVVIGASGAIYGLLLAYGLTYPNRIVLRQFPASCQSQMACNYYGCDGLPVFHRRRRIRSCEHRPSRRHGGRLYRAQRKGVVGQVPLL